MVKASGTTQDGKALAVFGLSEGNVRRLKEGKPILIDMEPFGMSGRVVIMYGETENAIAAELTEFLAPQGEG